MPGTANSGGRNAKDPDRLRASGTFRADRHDGFSVPQPPTGRPEPPKSLAGEAKAEWTRMVDRLEQAKTLTLVDDAVLYQYAQLFAETERITTDETALRRLSSDLKKAARKLEGVDLLEAIREIVKLQFLISKSTQQLRQGHMAVRQYLVEFGMTPSARTRVKILAAEKPKAKLMAFMGGKAEGA